MLERTGIGLRLVWQERAAGQTAAAALASTQQAASSKAGSSKQAAAGGGQPGRGIFVGQSRITHQNHMSQNFLKVLSRLAADAT